MVNFPYFPTRSSAGKGVWPMMMSLILLNRLPCKGLVKKSEVMVSVPQCFKSIPSLSNTSLMKKYLMWMCLDLSSRDLRPFLLHHLLLQGNTWSSTLSCCTWGTWCAVRFSHLHLQRRHLDPAARIACRLLYRHDHFYLFHSDPSIFLLPFFNRIQ